MSCDMRRQRQCGSKGKQQWLLDAFHALLFALLTTTLLAACGGARSGSDGDGAALSPTATITTQPTATSLPTPAPPTATTTTTIAAAPSLFTYKVINIYPHDPEAYTQGLIYVDGFLYESTGMSGRSSLRRVELETGKVLQRTDLAADYFGEGMTLLGDRLFMLTWRSNVAIAYDRTTLAQLETFSYPTEGWGLTDDEQRLIMSDGTDLIYFRDPTSFAELGRVQVRMQGAPVMRINELELVEGAILANVWQTDFIVRIDPATGNVTGIINLAGLISPNELAHSKDPGDAVLNGIAYDAVNKRLFVTGKDWPKLFEITLTPVTAP